jgi:DNA (cytosine-5)-methyltransferase 1
MAIPEDQLSPEQTEQRRIGKNGVLSCGYGVGGEGFYRRFCRHVDNGKELAARIVAIYRNSWAPAVPRLWRDLETSARRAMLRPDTTVVADCGVSYRLAERAGLPCLICTLLNGKLLHYANARLDGADKFGRPRWIYNAYKQGRWDTYEPYGGQLTEHVVSALARELLVHAMFALEAAGYPIVFTVHDEIVVERADVAREDIERIMAERPAWAEKLSVPVRVKARVGKRYAKGAAPTDGNASRGTAATTLKRLRTLRQLTFCEFFAGIGCARVGLGESWRCLFANDIDAGKAAIYRLNFGADHLHVGDVGALDPASIPTADMWWTSPPCQDVSEAGPRQGLAGRRSGAFWPFWKLIEKLNADGRAPRMIVLENVTGLLESHDGADIAAIRTVFERAGYCHTTVIIDAARFVPQSRKRVFVIGCRTCSRDRLAALVETAMAAPSERVHELAEVLEPDAAWRPDDEARRHLAMMSAANLAKVARARQAGRPTSALSIAASDGLRTERNFSGQRFVSTGSRAPCASRQRAGRAFNSSCASTASGRRCGL